MGERTVLRVTLMLKFSWWSPVTVEPVVVLRGSRFLVQLTILSASAEKEMSFW